LLQEVGQLASALLVGPVGDPDEEVGSGFADVAPVQGARGNDLVMFLEELEQRAPDSRDLALAALGSRAGEDGGALGEHGGVLHEGGIRVLQVLLQDGELQAAGFERLAIGGVLLQNFVVDRDAQGLLTDRGESFAEILTGDADDGAREHGDS
jgi:hypothetical protein